MAWERAKEGREARVTVKSMKGMNSTGRGPSRGRKVDNRNMESLEGQAERTLSQMRCGGLSSGGQESFMCTPPLEGMATHSSILVWRSPPLAEVPGRLYAMGSQIFRHN